MSADGYASPYCIHQSIPAIEQCIEPPTPYGTLPYFIVIRHDGERYVFAASMGQGSSIRFDDQDRLERSPYSTGAAPQATFVARTVAEEIAFLRQDLGLTVSEIAEWMGVTRPAVYGWLKDVQPQPETARLLAKVGAAATALADLKLRRPDHVVKRPLFNGRSALDVLRDGEALTTAQLATLKDLDEREETQRAAHSVGTPVRSLNDTAGDSTPVMRS